MDAIASEGDHSFGFEQLENFWVSSIQAVLRSCRCFWS
jgi:hypothetical protein